MSDNAAPNPVDTINVNEDYEVRFWCEELEVSEERLRQLVRDHGSSVAAVRSALGR